MGLTDYPPLPLPGRGPTPIQVLPADCRPPWIGRPFTPTMGVEQPGQYPRNHARVAAHLHHDEVLASGTRRFTLTLPLGSPLRHSTSDIGLANLRPNYMTATRAVAFY